MDQCELRLHLEKNHEASYGWALHCCGHRHEEAEDVLQNVYLKVLDGRARFRGDASFRTWLFAVIRRTAADSQRRQILRRLGLMRYESRKGCEKSPETPAEICGRSQVLALFTDALGRLPARQQEVLHLVFYQHLTLQEAAVAMGVSLGAARQHYDRGKQRLRSIVQLEEVAP